MDLLNGIATTPRYIDQIICAVIDPVADTAIWKWDLKGEAFGATALEEDPDGNGVAFTLDLRFPGQCYDRFTGLNYNYSRDYEPGTGRYIQSDPIGLDGGISMYGYVGGSPMMWSDPLGLEVQVCRDPAFGGNLGPAKHYWIKTDTYESGMGDPRDGSNAGNDYRSPLVKVETVSHKYRKNNGDRECKTVEGANETKVNKLIKPDQPLGYFAPGFNDCQSFSRDVLRQTGGAFPFNGKPIPIPYLPPPYK